MIGDHKDGSVNFMSSKYAFIIKVCNFVLVTLVVIWTFENVDSSGKKKLALR